MATVYDDAIPKHHEATQSEKLVITASSLGTVFEWYDFYLYGLLATIISAQFFSGVNETTGFIFALAAFAAGFCRASLRCAGVRSDRRPRWTQEHLPGDNGSDGSCRLSWSACCPLMRQLASLHRSCWCVMRLIQGLALGGEYGGAATYVAEHALQPQTRGLYTSFIQTTATLGLFAALLVVIGTRTLIGEEAFKDWGWRVPFLVSMILLAVSMWIRMQLAESPVFQKMKDEGTTSKAPLTEAFGQWKNAKWVLIALLGAVAGQAVVWYTGQFYAMFFLEKILLVDGATTNILIALALAIGTPFFIFFGWLSDKIGRKWIIMAGCALAVLTYFPAFHALSNAANPAMTKASESAPVTVTVNDNDCSLQFDPIGKNKFDSKSCDIAKSYLAKNAVSYTVVDAPAGTIASVKIGDKVITAPDPSKVTGDEKGAAIKAFGGEVITTLEAAGYPVKDNPAAAKDPKAAKKILYADPAQINKPLVVAILTYLVILVTMVYGPIAALLVELFPSRIRYTSMSLPYHIGNGWFGGFLPTTAFAMVAATGDIYYGLWYPIFVAGLTLVVGILFLPETFRRNIDD
jgi:MFS family permease